MAKKYLIKHWVNADFVFEKVVNEEEIDVKMNNLKEYSVPDRTFSSVMIQGSEKIKRTTYEEYDESINISNQNRTSDK
jgi:predicted SpoU family rRNA methylase